MTVGKFFNGLKLWEIKILGLGFKTLKSNMMHKNQGNILILYNYYRELLFFFITDTNTF